MSTHGQTLAELDSVLAELDAVRAQRDEAIGDLEKVQRELAMEAWHNSNVELPDAASTDFFYQVFSTGIAPVTCRLMMFGPAGILLWSPPGQVPFQTADTYWKRLLLPIVG